MLRAIRRAAGVVLLSATASVLLVPAAAIAEGETPESPPTVVTPPSISAPVRAGSAATCGGAVFDGTNLGPVTYDWFKRGGGQVGTGSTYTPSRDDIGWDITCRATVSNPAGSQEAYATDVSVEDGRPSVTTPPKITGKAINGLAVTCSTGAWSGDDNAYSYQWLLREQPIKGATQPRLLLLDAWFDKEVACRVTASNASGSASFTTNAVMPFHPPILAPLAKKQPVTPKLRVAVATGIQSKLVCNASCATLGTAFILTSDARRLGIRGKDLGGATIVGQVNAKRTFKGELLVTTTFNAAAKRKLASLRRPIRVDLLFETAWGPRYDFKMYHVAESRSVTLRP